MPRLVNEAGRVVSEDYEYRVRPDQQQTWSLNTGGHRFFIDTTPYEILLWKQGIASTTIAHERRKRNTAAVC
ncbi:uncharacterized protein RSE6_11774 [Rhynchosporium secalis]|uniref:Uncharacterized protein n=1 Tax=Rhynchosporium secalis TaxID=38038 RepID=A0A1E1MNS3_RHYSE|nr:uncharacterized protein RSE6_11774 [Rhynchosporium secalis]